MSEGAVDIIRRLQHELMRSKLEEARLNTENRNLRVALVTCGNFLHNLNSGRSHQGFNEACRAVEGALQLDSVARCRQLRAPPQHNPCASEQP